MLKKRNTNQNRYTKGMVAKRDKQKHRDAKLNKGKDPYANG